MSFLRLSEETRAMSMSPFRETMHTIGRFFYHTESSRFLVKGDIIATGNENHFVQVGDIIMDGCTQDTVGSFKRTTTYVCNCPVYASRSDFQPI